uniref:DUF7773 domain-containing protein n=1 Tax=Meloidogyne enterolobii TaxID=390850 RepID=A0A6V7XI41_MELEN|nr:unnamed protein product [Meloidogyne enterolobii]
MKIPSILIKILILFNLLIFNIFCLNCFDSQSPIPIRVTECKLEEVCYVEYYSLKTTFNSSQLAHYFDRFCVNRRKKIKIKIFLFLCVVLNINKFKKKRFPPP